MVCSPSSGSYKINFDGTNFKDMDSAGVGVIVKDCNGCFLAGQSRLIRGVNKADQVEAWAAFSATKLALELGIRRM